MYHSRSDDNNFKFGRFVELCVYEEYLRTRALLEKLKGVEFQPGEELEKMHAAYKQYARSVYDSLVHCFSIDPSYFDQSKVVFVYVFDEERGERVLAMVGTSPKGMVVSDYLDLIAEVTDDAMHMNADIRGATLTPYTIKRVVYEHGQQRFYTPKNRAKYPLQTET